VSSQGKPLLLITEEQTGRYKESQLVRAEIPWKPVPG